MAQGIARSKMILTTSDCGLAGWRFQYDHCGNLLVAHHRCRYDGAWIKAITSQNRIVSCPICGADIAVRTSLEPEPVNPQPLPHP